MRAKARARGTTLVETLSYSTLLLLLMGMVYSVLTLSLTYYRNAEDSGGLQHEAMAGLNRLLFEMGGTAASSIQTDTNGVLFLSARTSSGGFDYDSSGSLLWQKYVCYYKETVNGQGVLRRKEKSLGTPTSTVPSSLPTVASVKNDTTLSAATVARSISALAVTVGSGTTDVSLTATSDRFQGSTVVLSGALAFRQ